MTELNQSEALTETSGDPVQLLSELKAFTGEPPEFWRLYLRALGQLAQAESVYLLRRDKPDSPWALMLAFHVGNNGVFKPSEAFSNSLQSCLQRDVAVECAALDTSELPSEATACDLLTLHTPGEDQVKAMLLYPSQPLIEEKHRHRELILANDLAVDFIRRRSSRNSLEAADAFDILYTAAMVYEQSKFIAAAMTLCNEVAARYACSQVSLGFLQDNGMVKLTAISHVSNFDTKMEAVLSLEKVMEECVDQDRELLFPVPQNHDVIVRAHEDHARDKQGVFMCTVPVKSGGKIKAVLCCEREKHPFSLTEARVLSLAGDMTIHRLLELKEQEKWFGARLLNGFRRKASSIIGVEHTGLKLVALTISLILLALFAIRVTHRVEVNFVLKSDKMAFITTPYDGFVSEVHYEIGDEVEKGKLLILLDQESLLLEKAAAIADYKSYEREAEKSRADQNYANMLVNQAKAERAKARLDMVEYRLQQAEIKAPFDSVVVDGEWKEKLNAPVRQGDVLVKVAQLSSIFIELQIDQKDISFVESGMSGEFAFISDPEKHFDMVVEEVYPVAIPQRTRLVINAQAEILSERESWWRPGMTGVAKINAQKRSLWWILTHKTADTIRRFLWW